MEKALHWTEENIAAFLYKIAADFVAQLEEKMASVPLSQAEVAARLKVTEGRVSQILNNPGNLTLKMIIKSARALGMKIALVAYDDNDPNNERGPINSDIFRLCWTNAGSPRTFRHLQAQESVSDALSSEAMLVPAGARGHFIISRNAYSNRSRGHSPYSVVPRGSTSAGETTVTSLLLNDQNGIILTGEQ